MTAHRLRDVAQVLTSNVDKVIDPNEHPVRLCNYVDVYKNNVICNDMPFNPGSATAAEIKKFRLRVDDVIITKDSETSDDIGVPALVRSTADDLVCGYHLSILRADRRRMIGPFLYWHLLSKRSQEDFGNAANGVTRFGLTLGGIKGIPINVPNLATQRQIADFLDRETARIDLLIEKKQRLVELLGEKAKSVNEFFFLNSEPIGVQPLHRLYRVVTGKTPSRNEEDNFSDVEGLPWATPANLDLLSPVETTKEFLTEKGCEGQPIVDAGTVLLNGIGASVGKIGIAGTRLSFNQQIHALIAKKRVLGDRFLFFQLLTLKEQLVLLANSTTIPILNAERLGRLELRIYAPEDQEQHCANMDTILQHEGMTAQKINASIDRLKEYRSALITAAVTGQIDVEAYAKSGTTDRRLDAIQEEMEA